MNIACKLLEIASTTVQIPTRTVSASNAREHHMARYRRTDAQRSLARMCCAGPLRFVLGPGSYTVKLTRERGPRGKKLDDDNLRGALKAVRDGVADALRLDDGDARITWEYDDVPAKAWGVLVEVTRRRLELAPAKKGASK